MHSLNHSLEHPLEEASPMSYRSVPCQCEHAAQHNDGPCGLPSTETVLTDFGTYEMCHGCAVDYVSAGYGRLVSHE